MRRGRVRRCRQAGGQRTSSEGRRVCQRCALENEGVTSGLRGSPRAESGDRRPKRREVGRASMQAAALQAQGGACTWHARALRLPSGRAGRAGRGLGGSARAERLGGKRLRGLEGGAHRAHGLRSSGTASCVNFTCGLPLCVPTVNICFMLCTPRTQTAHRAMRSTGEVLSTRQTCKQHEPHAESPCSP